MLPESKEVSFTIHHLFYLLEKREFVFPTEPTRQFEMAELQWLVGLWSTTTKGSIKEVWSTFPDGLMGMFTWIRDGEIYLHEFMSLTYIENDIILQLRHFGKLLDTWEEVPLKFRLVEIEDQKLVFRPLGKENPGWIVYSRKDEALLFEDYTQQGKVNFSIHFDEFEPFAGKEH